MALTFDQHKAAIDAAYPTPVIDWERQDDHVRFGHHEVATVELTFNAEDRHYIGSHWQDDGVEGWRVRRAGKGAVIAVQVSWDDAKTAFAAYWEAHCEEQRAILAASAYGKDVVDDTPGETPQGAARVPAPWGAGANYHPAQSRIHRFPIRVRRRDSDRNGDAHRDHTVGGVGAVAL